MAFSFPADLGKELVIRLFLSIGDGELFCSQYNGIQ
jgi:hypothetical protein